MNPYIIYGIFHREDPSHVHYAGQTRVGIDRRRRGHLSAARTGSTLPSSTWLRENEPNAVFRVLHTLDDAAGLDEKEIETIAYLWSIGQAELNLLPGGGNTPSDWVPSDDLKKRWSEQRRYGGIATSQLTVSNVLEIRRMFASGLPDREISSLFNVGVQGVGHILRNESWDYLPWEPGTAPRNNPARPKVTDAEWDEVFSSLARAETVMSISTRLNISRGAISKKVRMDPERADRFGLNDPGIQAARKSAKYALTSASLQGQKSREAQMTDGDALIAKALLWSGYSQRDVALHLGVSKNAVNLMSSGASWKHVPWPIGPKRHPKRKKLAWDGHADEIVSRGGCCAAIDSMLR